MIFSSVKDLSEVIVSKRKEIFKNKEINVELLDYLNTNFLGGGDTESKDFMRKFLILYSDNFRMDNLYLESNNLYCSGSYSDIYLSLYKEEIVKIKKSSDKGDPSSKETFSSRVSELYFNDKDIDIRTMSGFIKEFYIYILWKSLLLHFDAVYNLTFVSFLPVIHRPFIVKFDGSPEIERCSTGYSVNSSLDNKDSGFLLGYLMKEYEFTLQNVITKCRNQEKIYNVISRIMIMLYSIYDLHNYGVTLLHRDVTANNIMLDTKMNINFIDFGFSLVSIRFKDGNSVTIGNFFNEEYAMKITHHYDIVFFSILMVEYFPDFLKLAKYYEIFRAISNYESNKKYITTETSHELWFYPYKATINSMDLQKILTDLYYE